MRIALKGAFDYPVVRFARGYSGRPLSWFYTFRKSLDTLCYHLYHPRLPEEFGYGNAGDLIDDELRGNVGNLFCLARSTIYSRSCAEIKRRYNNIRINDDFEHLRFLSGIRQQDARHHHQSILAPWL